MITKITLENFKLGELPTPIKGSGLPVLCNPI